MQISTDQNTASIEWKELINIIISASQRVSFPENCAHCMANGDEQSRPLPGSAASNLGGTAIQYGSDSDDTDDDGFLTADEHSAEPSPEDVCQQNTSSSDIHLPPIQTTTITAVISSIDIGGMQSSGGHSIKDESAIRTASSPSPAQPSNGKNPKPGIQ